MGVEKDIVFRSHRGEKLSSLMHFPFVREYQSGLHTERRLKHTVTHFRHHYSAECSEFVSDTIFHALTREASQVEINKTCVLSLKMLCITAGGSARTAGRGHLSC